MAETPRTTRIQKRHAAALATLLGLGVAIAWVGVEALATPPRSRAQAAPAAGKPAPAPAKPAAKPATPAPATTAPAPAAPTPAPAAAPAAPPTADPNRAQIVVTTSPPSNATVTWGSKRLGRIAPGQPLVIMRPRDSGPLDLVVRTAGYLPVQTRAHTFADTKLVVKLTTPEQKTTLLGYKLPIDAGVPLGPDGGVPPALSGMPPSLTGSPAQPQASPLLYDNTTPAVTPVTPVTPATPVTPTTPP